MESAIAGARFSRPQSPHQAAPFGLPFPIPDFRFRKSLPECIEMRLPIPK